VLLQIGVTDPEPIGDAFAEILHEHVGMLR
jgi:hypothetical protein